MGQELPIKFAVLMFGASCILLGDSYRLGNDQSINSVPTEPDVELPVASANDFGYLRLERRQPREEAQYYTAQYQTENCYGQLPGSTGDPHTDCSTFEVCQSDGRLNIFYCPDYTRFNNYLGVCDWNWKVDRYCNPYYQEVPSEYYNMGEFHGYAEEEVEEPFEAPPPPRPYRPIQTEAYLPRPQYKEPVRPYFQPARTASPEPDISISYAPTLPRYEKSSEPKLILPLEFKKPAWYDSDLTNKPQPLTYSEVMKPSQARPSEQYISDRRLGYDQIYAPIGDSPYKPYYVIRKK